MKTKQTEPAQIAVGVLEPAHVHRIAHVYEGGSAYCGCGTFLGPRVSDRMAVKQIAVKLRLAA